MRLFFGREKAKVVVDSVDLDLCLKAAVGQSHGALQAFSVPSSVGLVLSLRGQTQVLPAVIRRTQVLVVDIEFWPLASDEPPSQTIGVIDPAPEFDAPISRRMNET